MTAILAIGGVLLVLGIAFVALFGRTREVEMRRPDDWSNDWISWHDRHHGFDRGKK